MEQDHNCKDHNHKNDTLLFEGISRWVENVKIQQKEIAIDLENKKEIKNKIRKYFLDNKSENADTKQEIKNLLKTEYSDSYHDYISTKFDLYNNMDFSSKSLICCVCKCKPDILYLTRDHVHVCDTCNF